MNYIMYINMEGLTLVPNFITTTEHRVLIKNITSQKWNTTLSRLTQHYGYEYDYSSRSLSKYDKIPEWMDVIINRLLSCKYISEKPDQVIINRYLPGEGISAHIDATKLFKDKIYSISLGGACDIIYKKLPYLIDENMVDKFTHYLTPRTLLIMQGDARYKYTHEIEPVKSDMVRDFIDPVKIKRTTRYSITFRNVIK